MLHRGGADITVMTNVADDDYKPEQYKFVNIIDLYNENKIESYFKEQNFDALIILNGSFTIFGGVEGDLVWMNIANYNAINLFPKTPYLILCDLALVAINNMWSGMISKKPWGDKYKDKQLDVTRDDIVVITQAYDTKTMHSLIAKNKNAIKVRPENVRHFPFERFPSLYDKNYFEVNENPEYGSLAKVPVYRLRQILNQLQLDSYLTATNDEYAILRLNSKGLSVLNNEETVWMKLVKEQNNSEKETPKKSRKKKNWDDP